MTRRPRLALLAMVLAVILSGCVGGLIWSEDPTGEEVKGDTLAAMDGVETYTFNATLQVDPGSSGIPVAAMARASGAVDTRNERLRSTLSDPIRGETQTYIDGDTVYINDSETGWTSRQLETNYFTTKTVIDDHRALLKGAEVEHEGTEEIDGRTVNVLAVSVDNASVESHLEKLLGESNASAFAADTGGILENVTVETATIRYYTGQKDDLLYRVTVTGTFRSAGQTVSATLQMDFDDYNEELAIDIPPQATE
ncbi:MAG: DUF6612 family protein [Natrialbaceae archaeon]|nr:DUF6612 family protein [Natrialbaceae archaeon]